MATRAAIVGMGTAALVTLGLAAGFARAQTSDPPDLGDVVRVTPPAASQSPPGRSPTPRPTSTRTAGPSPGQDGQAVTPPRPPDSDDDGEVDDDADD